MTQTLTDNAARTFDHSASVPFRREWPAGNSEPRTHRPDGPASAPEAPDSRDSTGLHEPDAPRADIRIPLGTRLEELERVAIHQALEHCSGHRRQTAELLGISVRTLQRRLKSFALLARTR
jgi:DNA-binding NtrC family response regulator